MEESAKYLLSQSALGVLALLGVLGNIKQYQDRKAADAEHLRQLLALTERTASVTEKALGAVEAARAESRENQSLLRSVLETVKQLMPRR